MVGEAALTIFGKAITALNEDISKEKSKVITVFKNICSYPIKIVAAFITAPFLMIRLACVVKNPLRRIIAIVGLLIAVLLAYVAGTSLGTLAGFFFVASQVGWLSAIGFAGGTTISVVLSVVFSILIFNAVSYLFLKMSSQEVIDYLKEVSA